MVLTSASAADLHVLWHDLECGAYRADLQLWASLAGAAPGRAARVLDIGAGSGRVALELARAGHRVTALDSDAALLAALGERAGRLPVHVALRDARAFALRGPAHDLALMPMQTLQLLGGSEQRVAAFACAAAHMRPGALLACAIVTDVEPFDARGNRPGPIPELLERDGTRYESRAVLVSHTERAIVIERERSVGPIDAPGAATVSRDIVELEHVHEHQLWKEARIAGLHPRPSRVIAETLEHAGSIVVMLRA